MRTDTIRSPQPTELYKQCGTCHLRAQSTVPNTCRTCDRDYGVLPCSCGAAVCVECLKDPRHKLLQPLCHVCLRVTCSVCSTPCRAEGCQKWLCIHCKDAPPSCEDRGSVLRVSSQVSALACAFSDPCNLVDKTGNLLACLTLRPSARTSQTGLHYARWKPIQLVRALAFSKSNPQ
jgi:hypothetical protein